MGKTLCTAPACVSDRPRLALPGVKICVLCRDKLSNDLLGLPKLYDGCEDALTFEKRGMTPRVSGWRPTGISLDETAMRVRSDMIGVLSSWAVMIVEELDAKSPNLAGIWQLSTFLMIHFDWLLNHPAAADFAEEITDLTKAAHDVIQPEPGVKLDIGPCTHPGCGHTVCATIHGEQEFSPSQVSCDAGHVLRPDQWLLHTRRIRRAKRVLTQESPRRAA
jgi:hypothetical protein